MRPGTFTLLVAVVMVMAHLAPLKARAQTIEWGSDVKIVEPQKSQPHDPDYITLETIVPMKGEDLFEYFRASAPHSKFSDFLKANPRLGAIEQVSPVDAGTVFVVLRPGGWKSGE